jgi:hypothetical protein
MHILILLGTFWRQILAGSMMLIALGMIGICVMLGLMWWSSRDSGNFEWHWTWQGDRTKPTCGAGWAGLSALSG